MLDWYSGFLLCVLVLWAFASPRDKNALRIVLIATLFSEVLVDAVTSHFSGAWKLIIPGAVETCTILALLKWAKNRTGIMQAACLVVAWFAHFLCYTDIVFQTDVVYSRYEVILFWVSLAQLAAFHDTLHYNLGRIRDYLVAAWADCAVSFRPSGHSVALSVGAVDPKNPAVETSQASHHPALK